jgi:hypothetical protein
MPEEEKPGIFERQPGSTIILVLLFAFVRGVLFWALEKNPRLNPEYPTQTIEVPDE